MATFALGTALGDLTATTLHLGFLTSGLMFTGLILIPALAWWRFGLNEIVAEFESHWLGGEVEGAQYMPAEAAYFRDIVGGVVREQKILDPLIDATLVRGWPLKRIEMVLRAALRAGAYELAHRPDVPARVVTAEYVDIAAAFVDDEETAMVNAVLDQIAHQLRAAEYSGGG